MKGMYLVLLAVCLLLARPADAQTPTILSEPQSVTVNNASAATFTVVASNAFAYQWYFQGTNIVGETNSALSLDDVSSNQMGNYTVVVTSSNNVSVTSAPPATLTIVPGTVIQWTIGPFSNGVRSNFLLQLFDHDKPATVENFIHYITAGAYSNTFIDRDVTNFVIQGGDYVTTDRTTNGLKIKNLTPGTNFPTRLINEFGVGPLIHNRYGTIAMALQSGQSNSATSAFFFNTADNTEGLDFQDFTVFGRILYGTNSGSNVLQYFNTLSAPTNGIYDDFFQSITTLPVNFDGTNQPTDANLFYCDFQFISPTNPPIDTTPPTISITFPSPNEAFTNSGNQVATGTASDNVAVAQVLCEFSALTGLEAGGSETNSAEGAANWSFSLGANDPGVYELSAYAVDAAGNASAKSTIFFTNLATLAVITNSDGVLSTNLQYLPPGQQFSFSPQPGPGQQFVNWQVQGEVSLNPLQTFTLETNITLEVTYLSTNLPPGLAIISPGADSTVQTTNASLPILGTLPSSVTVTQVTVQLFVQSNAVTTALHASVNGTNWSLTESNLNGGPYTVVVVAEDSLGQEGVVSENFTALVAPPTIISQPGNVTVNAGSSVYFSITASNTVSYQWIIAGSGPIAGATTSAYSFDNVGTNQNGASYQVVLTARDGEVITSSPAILTVLQGTILQLTVSKFPDGSSSNLVIELFNHDKPATVENFIHYITSGAYSNTFFDTDGTNTFLQAGNLVTLDRTTNPFSTYNIFTGTNQFPKQVDSEYNVGPIISNAFGTLATVNSGSGFYFNSGDNSSGFARSGYTVFGRIISGTDTLNYFNTLAPGNGLYTNATYNDLPVNYTGTNAPADANLFYCDFTFLTAPPVDTNPPMVTITTPAPGSAMTNGSSVSLKGTAQDDVGVADVYCVLTSTTGAYDNRSQTFTATGATNWSVYLGNIESGVFQLTAYAQDGAGNQSAGATEFFTNLTKLVIITNVAGQLTTNPPQYLVPGQSYSFTAATGAGQQFYSWTSNGVTTLSPTINFTANGNLMLTATYLATNSPAEIGITSPTPGQQALSIQSVLTVTGTIASTNVAQVTCQFFVNSNAATAALPATISGTNWSLPITNLTNGTYAMNAVALIPGQGISVASESFKVLNVEQLTINVIGSGVIVSNPGPYIIPGSNYTFKAVPSSGQAFYSWFNGTATTLNSIQTIRVFSNTVLTATFVPENPQIIGLTFTYPLANAMLTNGTFNIAGRLPSSLVFTQMTCQLFLQSNGVTSLPQSATIDAVGAKWSLPVSNLTAGAYTILAVGYDTKGGARLVSEKFNLLSKLMVTAQGKGTVTPGMNGKYLQVGTTYTITATPKPGQVFTYWAGGVENSNVAVTKFIMSTNTVLTAYFATNLFPTVAGTYSGLFLDPAYVSPTNAGYVSVTVSGTGLFSGTLKFPGHPLTILDYFPYNGQVILYSRWVNSNVLTLALALDLTNGTGTISGYLADQSSTGALLWASPLMLYRGVTSLPKTNAPAAGKYVILLQPENSTNVPPASGYAAFSLATTGAIALGGTLPDNNALSESAKISKDGIWPVFIVPTVYKGGGMLIGWETNMAAGSSSGQLYWVNAITNSAVAFNSTGATYVPPLAGTNYEMILPGGITNTLPAGKTRLFTAQSNIVQITLLPTGVLSGTVNFNNSKLPFKGAFVNPTNGGGGFVIDSKTQTEGFQISPP